MAIYNHFARKADGFVLPTVRRFVSKREVYWDNDGVCAAARMLYSYTRRSTPQSSI